MFRALVACIPAVTQHVFPRVVRDRKLLEKLAPRAGFEPVTQRLTGAGYTTSRPPSGLLDNLKLPKILSIL